MKLPTQLQSKKVMIPTVIVAILVVAAAIIVPLTIAHNNAVKQSKQQAVNAASAYIPAAHKYLKTAAGYLDYVNASGHNDIQNFAELDKLETLQKSAPHLKAVTGAGAELPSYQKAKKYAAKVDGLIKQIDAGNVLVEAFRPYDFAYMSLNDVQNDISAGKLTTGDPVTSLKNVIVKPLTAAQAKFKKIKVTADYKKFAADLQKTFDDYIGSGNQLITMYQTGNVHSVNFNFIPQLDKDYDDLQAKAKPINADFKAEAKQTHALLKQP